MRDEKWMEAMDKLESIRLFSSLYIKKTRKGELTSVQQADALFRIALSGGITPLELSRRMGASKTIVSRIVDQLVQKDMIARRYDREDRRSYSLWITEKGSTELDGMFRYYLEPVYELERQMEEESLQQFFRLMKAANEILMKEKEGVI